MIRLSDQTGCDFSIENRDTTHRTRRSKTASQFQRLLLSAFPLGGRSFLSAVRVELATSSSNLCQGSGSTAGLVTHVLSTNLALAETLISLVPKHGVVDDSPSTEPHGKILADVSAYLGEVLSAARTGIQVCGHASTRKVRG